METKLARIAEIARTRPQEKFTLLAHLINEETIKQCHQEMNGKKAAGVDDVTKEEYGLYLDANVEDLIHRLKRQAYKPQPVRRVYVRFCEGLGSRDPGTRSSRNLLNG